MEYTVDGDLRRKVLSHNEITQIISDEKKWKYGLHIKIVENLVKYATFDQFMLIYARLKHSDMESMLMDIRYMKIEFLQYAIENGTYPISENIWLNSAGNIDILNWLINNCSGYLRPRIIHSLFYNAALLNRLMVLNIIKKYLPLIPMNEFLMNRIPGKECNIEFLICKICEKKCNIEFLKALQFSFTNLDDKELFMHLLMQALIIIDNIESFNYLISENFQVNQFHMGYACDLNKIDFVKKIYQLNPKLKPYQSYIKLEPRLHLFNPRIKLIRKLQLVRSRWKLFESMKAGLTSITGFNIEKINSIITCNSEELTKVIYN